MTARATVLVLLAAAAMAAPAMAANAAAEREARRDFQAGEAHFKAGLYAEALADYQAGYAAAPLPGFLINVAQCQRRLGDLAKARSTYQKFLLVAPDSPLVPQVRKLIVDLDQMLADEAAAGDKEAKAAPAPASVPALEASPPEEAQTSTATLTLTAAPAAAPAPARPLWKRWWFWGAVGAAVAAGTITAFTLSSPGATTIHDGTLGTLRR